MWKGVCLDEYCRQTLVYPECLSYVVCHFCGQSHATSALEHRAPLDPNLEENKDLIKCCVDKFNLPPKGPELIRVMGLCHYHEKVVSPLLSTYGMDKHTGKAKLLRLLTGRSNLDCSVFSDRVFMLEPRHVEVAGFGKDPAANAYLSETLKSLLPYNDNVCNLVALHVDGDGHCLVHAISRAVVGRELFWHPLRVGLKHHFNINLDKYKSLLGSWISNVEWGGIIEECDPDYSPTDGGMVGLRNIHVFGLANLLRRPIILIDCLQGMKASADYAAVFLPGLNPPMACRDKTGRLNSPLLLAWSSAARNHYVPLVPIKDGGQLPKIPRSFLPEVWGFPQSLLDTYVQFDEQNCLTIGGDMSLAQPYLLKLTYAMDELFLAKHGVPPLVLTDLYQYELRNKSRCEEGAGMRANCREETIAASVSALQEGRVARCILCNAISLLPLRSSWLRPGGLLYKMAATTSGFLLEGHEYTFRGNLYISSRYSFKYDLNLDTLVVSKIDPNSACPFCQECSLRRVGPTGAVEYEDGDRTLFPVLDVSKTRCQCGAKHYWRGNYYDNPPHIITLELEWDGVVKVERLLWFEGETEPKLNTCLYEAAKEIVMRNFPSSTRPDLDLEKLCEYVMEEIVEKIPSLNKQNETEGGSRSRTEEEYEPPRKKASMVSMDDSSPKPSTSST